MEPRNCAQCRREQRIDRFDRKLSGCLFNIFLSMLTTLLVLWLKKVI